MEVNKGVVGTLCDAVNILEMLLAVSEMTRLICSTRQMGLFLCLFSAG